MRIKIGLLAAFLSLSPIFRLAWSREAPPATTPVTALRISGADSGRIFDGIGALSAGASSRLLIDYPDKRRREILDFLFKPNFGAALQINKVEIGGDTNSTDGSEPSHQHAADDENYSRGYEWWLMRESKTRNPNVKLYGLEWGAPGWINPGGGDVWTRKNIDYLLDWIRHAKSDHGLTIDYLGGWNERGLDKAWYESFSAALKRSGFGAVKIIADDSFVWNAADDAAKDPAFAASFDIIGVHYPGLSNYAGAGFENAIRSGKPIWQSEMGSQPYDAGAAGLAKTFNQGYVSGKTTCFINWSTIWSVYRGMPFQGDGLMLADEPWSGHYVVGPSIWAVAHTTQFAQPGWTYLDHSCLYFDGDPSNGSCVTLKSQNGFDFSVIAETLDAMTPRTLRLSLENGLSAKNLHVWSTDLRSKDSKDWFVRGADIQPKDGVFSLELSPGHVYSLTTTAGQRKGETKPPPSSVLRLPYQDDFQSYPIGATARYFSDQMGAFEIAPSGGGRAGKCLRQMAPMRPVVWNGSADPNTLVGDPRWRNYRVSSDVLLEGSGSLDLIGRMSRAPTQNVINGYHLKVTDAGHWTLLRKEEAKEIEMASGSVKFAINEWHRLSLAFALDKITASIDGATVAKEVSDDNYSQGLAGYQSSGWVGSEFRNFRVDPIKTREEKRRKMKATATSFQMGYEPALALDGDPTSMWHAEYDPIAPALPQSITIDCGETLSISGIGYLPRQDGNPNGRITEYRLNASRDGLDFVPVISGEWADDASRKVARFTAIDARYFRLEAVKADNGFASAAEIEILGAKKK